MSHSSKLPSISATVTDALVNTLGSIGLSMLTLGMFVVLSTNIHSLVDQYLGGLGDSGEDPIKDMYTSYIRPMMAINLLNASHIYYIALIIAIIAVITAVDGALGYVNAVVATQARIPLRLVDGLNAETMEVAIANAGRTSLPSKNTQRFTNNSEPTSEVPPPTTSSSSSPSQPHEQDDGEDDEAVWLSEINTLRTKDPARLQQEANLFHEEFWKYRAEAAADRRRSDDLIGPNDMTEEQKQGKAKEDHERVVRLSRDYIQGFHQHLTAKCLI